jgi:hypothetical protein
VKIIFAETRVYPSMGGEILKIVGIRRRVENIAVFRGGAREHSGAIVSVEKGRIKRMRITMTHNKRVGVALLSSGGGGP